MNSMMSIPTGDLAECRRMFLKNYEISMNIGVHDFEKKGEQRVIVNIDVYVKLGDCTPVRDQLSEVVDYDFMRDTIARIIARGHIQLQETLCDEIARAMLEHPLVLAARVATEKPDVYPDCDGVGVEVFCRK
ncbi:MAG: dihydroneopterin aldolase [Burkholderiaceae bacterium]|nr:dihydroneopterin aldolase [Burkholderiaceae bacterium]